MDRHTAPTWLDYIPFINYFWTIFDRQMSYFTMSGNPNDPSAEGSNAPVVSSALRDTRYSQISRLRLNTLIRKLRDAGVETVLKDALPKVVVIGKQSAGKSSLIEGISKIKLPRAEGTCTRCPMEVRLSTSSDSGSAWKCKVSIVRPSQNADEGVEDVPEPVVFDVTEDENEVEDIVKRAQMAVLFNDRDIDDFSVENFPHHEDEFIQLISTKFSQHPVILDIIGADVDLTFVDLPGLVEFVEVRAIIRVSISDFLARRRRFECGQNRKFREGICPT